MRSYSVSTSNMEQSLKEAKKIKKFKAKDIFMESLNEEEKTKHNNQNHKTFIENNDKIEEFKIKNEKHKKTKTNNLLSESDIRISKPITINLIESEQKKSKICLLTNNIKAPLRGENKIILEEALEESLIKDDMEDIVKRRMSTHSQINYFKPKRPSTLNGSLEIEPSQNKKTKNIRHLTAYEKIPKYLLIEK